MWEATLEDGTKVGKDYNFLEIDQPIKSLAVVGASADTIIEDCAEFYLVFHAQAALGQQGQVVAIEIGGLKVDRQYHGFKFSKDGVQPLVYTKEDFPFGKGLKPGILIEG